MKHTIKSLTEAVELCLLKEVRLVRLESITKGNLRGYSYCDENRKLGKDEIKIYSDPLQGSVDELVVHEILHRILDKHLSPHFNYHIIEWFYQKLEVELLKRLDTNQQKRWRRAIRRRLVVGRKQQ